MKRFAVFMILPVILCLFAGCSKHKEASQIAATTLPVYEFTTELCMGTDLQVCQVVTQNVSCLHDYTLQSSQMRTIEGSEVLVISGVGLEDFLGNAISSDDTVIDASKNIELLCGEADLGHSHSHSHHNDPHIWLSPENAKIMAKNICAGLTEQYPQYTDIFSENLDALISKLDTLQAYGTQMLSNLSSRELITFHDGFSYFAEAFDLKILKAVEEDSGSEASAAELIEMINLVENHSLPAIFTEINGSERSAKTICAETGAQYYCLDMAMSGTSYFDAMYHNINTIKEAMG